MVFQHTAARRRLVTAVRILIKAAVFQHTAARRRLVTHGIPDLVIPTVSTHSRPKAAGHTWNTGSCNPYCFNTQPPEGGWYRFQVGKAHELVSTHSRPKAAGQYRAKQSGDITVSTHSRPKAAGTAKIVNKTTIMVSTHSRPKAAGRGQELLAKIGEVSTHSRPKAAGWNNPHQRRRNAMFQHTAARRRLGLHRIYPIIPACFNTQPPEGGWKTRLFGV